MKMGLGLLMGFFCTQLFAIYGVGDKPRNYCWKDFTDATVCLEDAAIKDTVRVLLYNTGWCGPCNTEFRDIARATAEFAGKPVTFISLSAAGWSTSSRPDKTFLADWRSKHKLNTAKASFIVAASPRDAGVDFFTDVRIPNVAIIDVTGEVVYKAINPGVSAIVREVRKVAPQPVPRRLKR